MKNQAAPACRGSVAQACKSVGRVWLIALLCLAHFAAWHAVATADAKSLPFQEISNAAPPALEAVDLDGSHIALDGFVGKTVLVHFFATWCEPCRPELASLSELKAKHSDAIEILAVSVAEPRVRLQRFFEKNPVNFPVVMDADRSTSQGVGCRHVADHVCARSYRSSSPEGRGRPRLVAAERGGPIGGIEGSPSQSTNPITLEEDSWWSIGGKS